MSEFPTGSDLRKLMAVVEDGRQDRSTGALPWATVEGLAKLVRCDVVTFTEADRPRRRCLVQQQVEDSDEFFLEFDSFYPETEPYWRLHRGFLPYQHFERTADFVSVIRWSDFYTRAGLRSTPLFAEYFAPHGYRHCISMAFRTPCWRRRSLGLGLLRCSGADFDERDRVILQLLRPHLHELYLASRRSRRGKVHLTLREREVLRLVGEGCTNAEIAEQLVISVSTVRKHMEHVFDRTGVRTRTAALAVLRADEDAISPG
jgi:DNA-binding CsgD family transcriptional regulator